jgi:hypothetical protein
VQEVVLFGGLLLLFIYCVTNSNVLTMMANPSLSEPQFHVDENQVPLLPASSFHCIDFF